MLCAFALQGAWDEMKRRIIEEKLEKLGVGGGLGSSSVPHIHAPHARAASVRHFFISPALQHVA